ncbi:hypothetical protein D9M70_616590 [compost metagenome]
MASGTSSISAAAAHKPIEIGLATRMAASPLLMDSARRRFCSIMSPSTKPRISSAMGMPCLRNR